LSWQLKLMSAPKKVPHDFGFARRIANARAVKLDEAKDYLQRAVALATEDGNKWYACQAF